MIKNLKIWALQQCIGQNFVKIAHIDLETKNVHFFTANTLSTVFYFCFKWGSLSEEYTVILLKLKLRKIKTQVL